MSTAQGLDFCPPLGFPTLRPRPLATTVDIFFVPETDKTTWLHSFVTLHMPDRLRPLTPMLKRAAVFLTWWEVRDDARFMRALVDAPPELKGLRLGKFDKPLIHNRKLLRELYWGTGNARVDVPTAAVTR